MKSVAQMAFEYIQRAYKVPAKKGQPVAYTDIVTKERRTGKIRHAKGHYILITFDDGDKCHAHFHPTWQMEYLTETDANPAVNGERSGDGNV